MSEVRKFHPLCILDQSNEKFRINESVTDQSQSVFQLFPVWWKYQIQNQGVCVSAWDCQPNYHSEKKNINIKKLKIHKWLWGIFFENPVAQSCCILQGWPFNCFLNWCVAAAWTETLIVIVA